MTTHTNLLRPRGLILCAALLVTATAQAQVTLSSGHTDIGAAYSGGNWDLHIHTDDEEFAPGDAILFVSESAAFTRPASSDFAFTGVDAGQTLYRLPQSQNPELLYIGFSTEEIVSGSGSPFDSYLDPDPRVNLTSRWINFNVTSVTGPGVFSIWQSGDEGPVVWVSTVDGLNSSDRVVVGAGSHLHYNWGFSVVGTYEVTLQASGFIGGVPSLSDPTVFTFQVGAIPEPSTYAALAGLGALVLALSRRRRA
jgi:surface-anchored protein